METKYKTIYADPPWNERGAGKIVRGAQKHYSLMKTPDIINTMNKILENKVADNAHLYLWVTNNFLISGLEVIKALNFRYITNIVWAKNSFGIGQYFRGQHELCLFGIKGRGFTVKTDTRSISSWLQGKSITKRKHSQKPEEMYELIENRSYGPYYELFARNKRENWDTWGDEIKNI